MDSPQKWGRGSISEETAAGVKELEDAEADFISPSPIKGMMGSRWELAQRQEQLRTFEANRRSKCRSKLDSTKLYWQAHVNLLQTGLNEVNQARRLICGLAKAHAMLSKTLDTEHYRTHLRQYDEQPRIPSRQQVKDALINSSEHTTKTKNKMFNNDLLVHFSSNENSPVTSRSNSPSPASRLNGNAAAAAPTNKPDDMVASLNQSTHKMQHYFRHNAFELESTFSPKLIELIEHAEDALEELSGRGKSLIEAMGMTEKKVIEAWEAYFTVTEEREFGSRTGEPFKGGHDSFSNSSNTYSGSNNNSSNNTRDRWLALVNYHHTLAQHQVSWELGLDALSEIYASARGAEVYRRLNLREVCISFLSTLQQVYNETEIIQTENLVHWIGKDTSEEAIQQIVQKAIEKNTTRSVEIQTAPKHDIPGHPDRVTMSDFYKDLFSVSSPLESEFITIAVVGEWFRTGHTVLLKRKVVLLVITKDNLLHIFETPTANKHFQPNYSVSDSAIKILDIILTQASRRVARGISHTVRPELREYQVQPTWSIPLNRLSIVMTDGIDDSASARSAGSLLKHSVKNAVSLTVMLGSGVPFDTICLRLNSSKDQFTLIHSIHQEGDSDGNLIEF